MSTVSNYVLLPHYDDIDKLKLIKQGLPQHFAFRGVHEEAGGNKYLEMPVWTMAGNGCVLDVVVRAIQNVAWAQPKSLVLMHADQEAEAWEKVEVWDEL